MNVRQLTREVRQDFAEIVAVVTDTLAAIGRELNELVSRIQQALLEMGIGPGDRVFYVQLCDAAPDAQENVLVEAMACGVPVLATPVGGIEEQDPHRRARHAELPLSPWAEGERDHWVAIPVEQISGRRLVHVAG